MVTVEIHNEEASDNTITLIFNNDTGNNYTTVGGAGDSSAAITLFVMESQSDERYNAFAQLIISTKTTGDSIHEASVVGSTFYFNVADSKGAAADVGGNYKGGNVSAFDIRSSANADMVVTVWRLIQS